MKVTVNGQSRQISEGRTVAGVLREIGVSEIKGVAVAVDAEVVPAAQWDVHLIKEGQRIEVLRAVQGG